MSPSANVVARPALLLLGLALAGLVPARPAQATSCDPRTAAEWMTRCATAEGRSEIERLLPECRRRSSLADIATARDACAVLAFGNGASACDRARRQVLAAALNVASGRLGPDCCIEWDGGTVHLGDVFTRHDDDCRAGRNCETIRAFFQSMNDASRCRACGGGTGGGTSGSGPAPASPSGDCCAPRSKGFWHRQCMGLGLIESGKEGRPALHPAFTETELRRIMARADRRIGGRCETACEALDQENYRTPRGRALAQYAAFVLNLEAGLLDGCSRSRCDGELRRCESLFDDGRFDECARLAEDVNLGRSVRRCANAEDDGPGHHGHEDGHDDEDHHGDDGPGRGRGHGGEKGDKGGKGHGKKGH